MEAHEGVKRKLTAILYADVAGYSRLTGDDEEGTHRLLSAYLDVITATIEKHGGRTVHFAGDAVLAEFASVVDALACTVEAQRELRNRNEGLPEDRRVQFRMGINLGDVIVDRENIYGGGVNIAARLEGLAQPGGICISGGVYQQVKNKLALAFEFMGPREVKNISDPVPVFQVHLDPGAAGGGRKKACGRRGGGRWPSSRRSYCLSAQGRQRFGTFTPVHRHRRVTRPPRRPLKTRCGNCPISPPSPSSPLRI